MAKVKINTAAEGWVELVDMDDWSLKVDQAQYDNHLSGVVGERHPAAQIDYPANSTVTSPKDLQAVTDTIWSAGVMNGCQAYRGVAIGSIEVTAGTVLLRVSETPGDSLVVQAVPAYDETVAFIVPDGTEQFIYVEYAGVDTLPLVKMTNNAAVINGNTTLYIAQIVRHGEELNILANEYPSFDHPRKNAQMHLDLGMQHAPGGTVVSAVTGETTFAISPGLFYLSLNRLPHPAFDSLGEDVFTYWYETAPDMWVSTPDISDISDTQYQTGSGLASIPATQYSTSWVYCTLTDDTPQVSAAINVHVIYGYDVFDNHADAEASVVPVRLPPILQTTTAQIIGRAVVQQAGGITQVVSAFSDDLGNSPLTVHNALSGLQGGTTNEMYHLDAANYNYIMNKLYAVAAYGGIEQSAALQPFNLTNTWQTIDTFDTAVLTTPRAVIQDFANNQLTVTYQGVYALNIYVAIEHNEAQGSREMEFRLWNATQGVGTGTTIVGTARNQTITNFSVSGLFFEVTVQGNVNLQLQVQAVAGSTYTAVELVSTAMSVNMIGENRIA